VRLFPERRETKPRNQALLSAASLAAWSAGSSGDLQEQQSGLPSGEPLGTREIQISLDASPVVTFSAHTPNQSLALSRPSPTPPGGRSTRRRWRWWTACRN
jgi:hypothetical protein